LPLQNHQLRTTMPASLQRVVRLPVNFYPQS
jgi:hypothetical protein